MLRNNNARDDDRQDFASLGKLYIQSLENKNKVVNYVRIYLWVVGQVLSVLTPFDMGFFEPSVMGGGGGMIPHHNFSVIASMKKFVTSLLFRNYYVITCILTDV